VDWRHLWLAALPVTDSAILLEMTFGMLGMAGLRTFEKLRGVSQ
jgi:hypothetical protein